MPHTDHLLLNSHLRLARTISRHHTRASSSINDQFRTAHLVQGERAKNWAISKRHELNLLTILMRV